jgi:hypothetical protein
VYDPAGHVAVQVERARRTQRAPFEGPAHSVPGYVAYFGTYDVDVGTRTVTHRIEGDLDPKRIGPDLARGFEPVGERLRLTQADRPERHLTR